MEHISSVTGAPVPSRGWSAIFAVPVDPQERDRLTTASSGSVGGTRGAPSSSAANQAAVSVELGRSEHSVDLRQIEAYQRQVNAARARDVFGHTQPETGDGDRAQAGIPSASAFTAAQSDLARGADLPANGTTEITPSADKQDRAEDGTSSNRRMTGLSGLAQSRSPEEAQKIAALRRRDAQVRAHERAHLAAAGGVARGGANYQYVIGPDGRLYAVGGEVQIDTSAVPDDPEATITKAQTIRRAALAPANPSGQDRAVAAAAAQMEAAARQELIREKQAERQAETSGESEFIMESITGGKESADPLTGR